MKEESEWMLHCNNRVVCQWEDSGVAIFCRRFTFVWCLDKPYSKCVITTATVTFFQTQVQWLACLFCLWGTCKCKTGPQSVSNIFVFYNYVPISVGLLYPYLTRTDRVIYRLFHLSTVLICKKVWTKYTKIKAKDYDMLKNIFQLNNLWYLWVW